MPAARKVPTIKLERICKRFGDNVALDDVSIDLTPGEITALLGENGAGKSTLMKVLYGYYTADSGRVLLDDIEVKIRSPRDAREHGIFMVMQSPSLVPELPLFENLMMFDPRMRGASTLLTPRSVRDLSEATVTLANQLVPGVDFKKRVFEFDLPTIQLLEIVKVVMCEPRMLILDEPSAILGDHEMRRLYDYLAMQRESGRFGRTDHPQDSRRARMRRPRSGDAQGAPCLRAAGQLRRSRVAGRYDGGKRWLKWRCGGPASSIQSIRRPSAPRA